MSSCAVLDRVEPEGREADALLDLERWEARLPELAERYRTNHPYPHIHLTEFLPEETIQAAAHAFPKPHDTTWIQYKHYNENKLGKNNRAEFPPVIGRLIDELNSPGFVEWIAELTGIPGLLADPSLEGGGMHQTEPGGFLNMHVDFSHHHHQPRWRRRCNLIIYLNEGWDPAWGGAIEFWDKDVKACQAKYPPLWNHAVIFSTTEESYHGYPNAITCPEGVTRKSLALYYYTVDADPAPATRATKYRARPGEGIKALWVWLDNRMLATYSWLKRRLGLSDNFASKVLGWFGRK